MSYPEPLYTKTPNLFLDQHLPKMGCAEVKVVLAVIRKTFGWHQEREQLSIQDLQRLTGLSNRAVIDGTEEALKRGVIKRRVVSPPRDGKGPKYEYWLAVESVEEESPPCEDTSHPPVNKAHTPCEDTSHPPCEDTSHHKRNNKKENKESSSSARAQGDSPLEEEDFTSAETDAELLTGDEPWVDEGNSIYVEEANALLSRYAPENCHELVRNQWGSGTNWAWSAITSLYREYGWRKFVLAVVITVNVADDPSPSYMKAVLSNLNDAPSTDTPAEDDEDDEDEDTSHDLFMTEDDL